jgi:hypothetical protein
MAGWWSRGGGAGEDEAPPGVDTQVAHIARVYDYWLGGKDNFAADRHAADQARAVYPAIGQAVRAQRAFLGRAVRYLVAQEGIRQILDIGTGIPAASNIHEVAQSAAPGCRVVYVDNDRCKPGCANDASGCFTASIGQPILANRSDALS